MERFADEENPLELADKPGAGLVRAVALASLWRLLLIPGSRVVVIASNRRFASRFFGFLHEVTTKIDPALSSVCRWTRWSTMKVGHDAGYECRLVSNVPSFVQGLPEGATTIVILGASDSEPAFVETMQAAEQQFGREGVRVIRIW